MQIGHRLTRRRLLGAMSSLAAGGALRTVPTAASAPAGGTADHVGGVTADRVSAAVAQLDGVANSLLAQTNVPGMAIAVVYQDRVRYLKGFGVRRAGTGGPVSEDTIFQLASVSKPVASTVVAALVGRGVVSWDDRIIDHDPGFEMHEPWVTSQVTLRDMFAHRSGLPDHAGDLLEDIGYSREEVLYRLRYQRPASSFRSEYAYTNFGLTEAAVAAANAAGKSWEDISNDALYQPAGMTSTSSHHADFLAAQNHASLHVRVGGVWTAKFDRDPDAQSPAGGASSSARDMAQWLRIQLGDGALDGRQIVAADALGETHRPQMIRIPPHDPSTDRADFYGLGWNVSYDSEARVRLSHSGAFAMGAATAVFLMPAEQLGIAVLTNAMPIGLPEAMAHSFLDLALSAQIQQDWLAAVEPLFAAILALPYAVPGNYAQPPAGATPSLAPGAYTGAYANDLYGDVRVVAATGGLTLQMGPGPMAFPLRHYDRDVFAYDPPGENAGAPSGVTFAVGPNGEATSVRIDILNEDGQGTFTRRAADGG